MKKKVKVRGNLNSTKNLNCCKSFCNVSPKFDSKEKNEQSHLRDLQGRKYGSVLTFEICTSLLTFRLLCLKEQSRVWGFN